MPSPASSWVLITATFLAYLLVQGNVGKLFPLAPADAARPYFEGPYWVGLPRNTAIAVTALQMLGTVGYFLWTSWALGDGRVPHATTLINVFWMANLLWPFASYAYVRSPSAWRAALAILPLGIAACCVFVMTIVTFVMKPTAQASVGVLLLGALTILADGVGWSAACVAHALANTVSGDARV